MGAWIETRYIINYFDSDSVAPLWVRGLKHAVSVSHDLIRRRTLMGAWIETGRSLPDLTQSRSHPYGCVD